MSASPQDDDRPITRADLERVFVESEKPEAAWRIGGESEKFGVHTDGFTPLAYEGPRGVRRIFEVLARDHGWHPHSETEGGPVLSLTRGMASITLEPGAQFELSGAPLEDVHQVRAEMAQHLEELAAVSAELDLAWLGVGFHPLATQADLSWVPKQRYGVMKRYLPTKGPRGLDMMRRTATVQANFDYASEEDAMRKVVALLKVSPVVHAMTSNAPFYEGRVGQNRSERGAVWLGMDPSRSGLVPALWDKERPRYADYVEWVLDSGMFLFRRGDSFVHNTGQTFRSFLKDGFEGHRATYADWVMHVNSMFPEARLKRTIEARACDSLPMSLIGSVPALLTGLLYDAAALDRVTELTRALDVATVQAARPDMVARGLAATLAGRPVRAWAEDVLQIAAGGLSRRARRDAEGQDERVFLRPLEALIAQGKTPADALVEGLAPGAPVDPAEIVRRTRM